MTQTALQAAGTRYYEAKPGIRWFRYALGATQTLWPALAVRVASRLFATPLPLKLLRRNSAWGQAWQVESWPFESAELTIYSPASSPPGAPTALLVHGWGGHAGQMRPMALALAERGLRPVIVEMPAHGRSAGSSSTLPQFARAIEYAYARLQQSGQVPQVAAAHSMGASALAYAASRGLDLQRLVLVAPPASAFEFTRVFAHVFGLRENVRAAMQDHIEAREAVLMARFEPDAIGPRIGMPTLVVHDRDDAVNRFADGQAYAQAIAHAKLVATSGLGHRKLLQDATVLQQVADFAAAAPQPAQSSSASAA